MKKEEGNLAILYMVNGEPNLIKTLVEQIDVSKTFNLKGELNNSFKRHFLKLKNKKVSNKSKFQQKFLYTFN